MKSGIHFKKKHSLVFLASIAIAAIVVTIAIASPGSNPVQSHPISEIDFSSGKANANLDMGMKNIVNVPHVKGVGTIWFYKVNGRQPLLGLFPVSGPVPWGIALQGLDLYVGVGGVKRNLYVTGDLNVGGTKNFIYPINETHEIVYTSLETGKVRAEVQGSGKLVNGIVVIELPSHFTQVTNPEEGYNTQVTLTGYYENINPIGVSEVNSTHMVVREMNDGKSDATFDWRISGIRKGYEDKEIIQTR